MSCLLCHHQVERFAEDSFRAYFRCPNCGLIFADPASHPSLADEKARYDKHRNHPDDAGYREYLDRLAKPLLERLKPGMKGLDYGCGPSPVLSMMLKDAGMVMSAYDPFYADDKSLLDRQYDFVTCTEVVEHFRDPAREWKRLASLIVPGGWLGIMTQLVPDNSPGNFVSWHYRNDHTHLCFYSRETFDWLAGELSFDVDCLDEATAVMKASLAS